MGFKWIVLTSLAANVVVAIVISVLIALHSNNSRESSPVQDKPGPTYTHLDGSSLQDCESRSLTPGGKDDTITVLLKMFNDILKNSTEEREKPSNATVYEISALKPVVHRTGVSMTMSEENDTEWTEVTGWMEAGEGNLVRNGFKVKGGRLVVPTSGRYRFYTHMKFCAKGPSSNKSLPFGVSLCRMGAGTYKEQVLVNKTHLLEVGGVIGNTPDLREYGLFTRVVEHFDALDELYVKVKYISALVSDKEWSYVGAHIAESA